MPTLRFAMSDLARLISCAWGAAFILWQPAVSAGAGVQGPPIELTLIDALARSESGNHDLRLAQEAVQSAQAGVTAADALPNPTITLQTLNINPHQGIGSGDLAHKTVDTTVLVSQLFERGDKRRWRRTGAQAQLLASREDLADSRRQTAIAVGQAYYDLVAAQHSLSITRELSDAAARELAIAIERHAAGDLAQADVDRVRIDALHAESDMRDAQATLAKMRLTLAVLLGLEGDAARVVATSGFPQVSDTPDRSLVSDGDEARLAARADVKAAQARVVAARAALDLALSLRTRDVTVGVSYEHWPTGGGNQQGTNNSFGISASVPLFTRYDYSGEIRAAEVGVDAAEESLAKIRGAAIADIAQQRDDLEASGEKARRYHDALAPAAERALQAAQYAFEQGAIGVTDLLDAQRTHRAIELEMIAADNDYAHARAAWDAVAALQDGPAKGPTR